MAWLSHDIVNFKKDMVSPYLPSVNIHSTLYIYICVCVNNYIPSSIFDVFFLVCTRNKNQSKKNGLSLELLRNTSLIFWTPGFILSGDVGLVCNKAEARKRQNKMAADNVHKD